MLKPIEKSSRIKQGNFLVLAEEEFFEKKF